MNICVYGAASDEIADIFKNAGEALGESLARRGHSLIFGGGASGMMGAVARGADRAGGNIISVAPSFFDIDGILYPQCTEYIFTETMRERKQILEDRSDAFIVSPGGIGTFDEFFEIFEEEDEESSSADLEDEDDENWEPDITPEDYLEWCASSCGMTYNAYIGKPWLDN